MKVWMVFVQGDDATWLEASWDIATAQENPDGWRKEVKKVIDLCASANYEYRILEVDVPSVYEAFEIPKVTAKTLREAS